MERREHSRHLRFAGRQRGLCVQRTRQLILEYIQQHGEGTVEQLAHAVDLAPVTVRHHLNVLGERGMLEVTSRPTGRGRPKHYYRLSPVGGENMHGGRPYAALVSRLLDEFEQRERGAAGRAVRDIAARAVHEAVGEPNGRPIEESLEAAVDLLRRDGFSTRWERDGDSYLVHELGCPFQLLSDAHRVICVMDMEIIRRATGANVTREAWRRDGSPTCTYRVVPKMAARASTAAER